MKNNTTRWIVTSLAIAALALLVGSTVAEAGSEPEVDEEQPCAQRCQRASRAHGAGHLGRFAAELQLDDEQQARLDVVVEQQRQRRSAHRGVRGDGLREVMADLLDGEVEPDAVHARVDERFDAARDEAHAAADAMLAFLDSLDEQQLQQLADAADGPPCARGDRCCCGGCRGRDH